MTIELPASVEAPLRDLARKEKGEGALVEEAFRALLETAAMTDLDASAVGET